MMHWKYSYQIRYEERYHKRYKIPLINIESIFPLNHPFQPTRNQFPPSIPNDLNKHSVFKPKIIKSVIFALLPSRVARSEVLNNFKDVGIFESLSGEIITACTKHALKVICKFVPKKPNLIFRLVTYEQNY